MTEKQEIWSAKKPAKPGFYWIKFKEASTPEVAHYVGGKKWLFIGIHASDNDVPFRVGPKVEQISG